MFFLGLTQFHTEEAINGNLAKDLIDGLVLPIVEYQYYPFAHGPLVLGFVLLPFFLALGKLFAAVKVMALLIALAVFLVFHAVVRRAFGERATWPFVLLYLACPFTFLDLSNKVWGNHHESLLFTGIILLLLHRWNERGQQARGALLVGVACGFGAFFCMQALVPTALAGLLLFALLPWKKRPVQLAATLAGFAIGFLPSIAINAANGFWYRNSWGAYPVYESKAAKASFLVTDVLPALPGAQHGWANAGWMILAGVALILLAATLREDLARLVRSLFAGSKDEGLPLPLAVLLFVPVWLIAYMASHWDIVATDTYRLRYAVVWFPFLFAAVAGTVRLRRWLAWALAIPMAAVVLADGRVLSTLRQGIGVAERDDLAQVWTAHPGYFYDRILYDELQPAVAALDDEAEVRAVLDRVDERYASFADEIRAAWAVRRAFESGAPVDWTSLLAGENPVFVRAAGQAAGARPWDEHRLDPLLAGVKAGGVPVPREFWQGAGMGVAGRLIRSGEPGQWIHPLRDGGPPDAAAEADGIVSALASLPFLERALSVEGMGYAATYLSRLDHCGLFVSLARADPAFAEHMPAYLRGHGRRLAQQGILTRFSVEEGWLEYRRMFAEVECPLPPSHMDDVEEGFASELAARGYALQPADHPRWRRIVFVGYDQRKRRESEKLFTRLVPGENSESHPNAENAI